MIDCPHKQHSKAQMLFFPGHPLDFHAGLYFSLSLSFPCAHLTFKKRAHGEEGASLLYEARANCKSNNTLRNMHAPALLSILTFSIVNNDENGGRKNGYAREGRRGE